MPRRICLGVFFLFFLYTRSFAQSACTTLGQTPSTAFPVCGTSVFQQTQVPLCGGSLIPVPGCSNTNAAYGDLNPFWYTFTCFTSGTLGFLVTPNNLKDDYDWQLFDITGHDPNDVYTDSSLFVVGNWSGNSSIESSRGYTGITGASSKGTSNVECASNPKELGGIPPYSDATTFSEMPNLVKGHTYLLLVSHFTQTQSGYGLSFNGGTAVITDTTKPALKSAYAGCSYQSVSLVLNKKMKCSSLATDGSDFSISPALAQIVSAQATNCTDGFDMDSIVITFDKILPAGNYQLIIKNGNDQNTLLDNCDAPVPQFDSLPFSVSPITLFDSIVPISCSPTSLSFVFINPIKCNSVAPDGSDFVISGSSPVSVIQAFGASCTNGVATTINVTLNKPIQTAGFYTVTLKTGSDGNTLIDQCAHQIAAGQTVSFQAADTVSANFSYKIDFGCTYDTLFYAHDGKDHANEWEWTFGTDGTSSTRDSFFLFNDYGTKHIQLITSNGVCSDSASADINLDNQLLARFNMQPVTGQLCPEDLAYFTDSSIGKIVSWYWIFGDGTTNTQQNPPPKQYADVSERNGVNYPIALIVKNNINCSDTAHASIKILYNCYIAVPSAFTPNGDGLNDYLYPLNAYKAADLEFRIYNRYGQLVFRTTDWTKKWDGTINGIPQGSGVYVWMLSYTNSETGKRIFQKGTSILIR